MNKIALCAAFLATITGIGCAGRPALESFLHLDTVDVVQKIRCELRDATRKQTREFLKRRSGKKPRYLSIVHALEDDEKNYARFFEEAEKLIDAVDAEQVRRYEIASFAYEFTFEITENNDLTGGADFTELLTNGIFKLGLSGENKHERKLKRNFKLLDTFRGLATDPILDRSFCSDIATGRNHTYPITGKLDLEKTLGQFFTLNQSGGLAGGLTGLTQTVGAPKLETIPAMADTLTFTTTISGTASPSVELSAVGSNFQLVKANISATAKRVDVHTLVFVVALPRQDGDAVIAPTFVAQRALLELERQRRNENRQEIIDNLLNG